MPLLTPISPARAANALTMIAADAGGDAFDNTGSELLLVTHTNGGGSAVTLTIVTQITVDGEPVDDKEITIAPGSTHLLGPFPKGTYNDSNGRVQLTYSAHTDITVKPITQ
jgi:hypothetical protein